MANIIKPKRSSTAGKVPTTSDIQDGEIAINSTDAKIYTNKSGTITQVGAGALSGLSDVSISSPTNSQVLSYNSSTGKWQNATGGAGSGDVQGPASSTDNALARFDGTTGKIIQNGTVTQDDNGTLGNVNAVSFDTTPTGVPATVATMSWDDGDGVPSVLLKGGNTTLQVGTQEYARVYNDSGATLTIGQVVYISGAQGNRVAVKLARANVEATSFGTIGFVAETIANGAEGFIIVSGALYKLNTTGLTAGATVYLSPTTAGAFTTTKPQAPDQLVVLGWVERVSTTVGSIYVKIDNGYELDELHDVQIISPASGNTLIYDASVGVWKNANLTDGTGISITEGAGSITVANTGVLGVTATSPVASSGGQNPVISMPAATTSANGYLTSTDWNTFNGKQAALVSGTNIKTVNSNSLLGSGNVSVGTVTSVSGTGTVSGLTLSGTVTSSGSLTLGGTLSVAPLAVSDQANTSTGYFDLPAGTDAQRPASPATGMMRYNSTQSKYEVYTGTEWQSINTSAYSYAIDYLVVAGGGSGGSTGGGGAGGYLANTGTVATTNAYTVTIGAGGAGVTTPNGNAGSNTSLSGTGLSVTATGGGRGGGGNAGAGGAGGSGGGAGADDTAGTGGAGTAGQGNNGGNGTANGAGTAFAGGGGGGAGATGGNGSSSSVAGNGGNGSNWQSLGTTYAGGGGGGAYILGGTGTRGTGGSGGGGSGGQNGTDSTSGSANTGGGGGARGLNSSGNPQGSSSGAGGSGIVIIRYAGSQRGTGGTVTTSGGYTYHTFTSSGTFTA